MMPMNTQIEDKKRMPIYFPLGLLARLKESAKVNMRSLNKEVMYRLEQSFVAQEKTPDQVAARHGVNSQRLAGL
jgi:hypothetical protein